MQTNYNVMKIETESSYQRLELLDDDMKVNFIENGNKSVLERMKDPLCYAQITRKEILKSNKKQTNLERGGTNLKTATTHNYKISSILQEIGNIVPNKSGITSLILAFAFLRIPAPFVLRYLFGEKIIGSYLDILILAIFLITADFYHLNNLRFICVGHTDFSRKFFMFKILKDMISPKKDPKFKFSKYIPTMFLSCAINMCVWDEFREVVLDLGKKYTKRIEVYISVFIVSYLTLGIFVFLVKFEFIPQV